MKEKNIWNINGTQVNVACGNAIINTVQYNENDLDSIVDKIEENLYCLKNEDVENIHRIIDLATEELKRPKPKQEVLLKVISGIASMVTIANGAPTLANNLQNLINYITKFIA